MHDGKEQGDEEEQLVAELKLDSRRVLAAGVNNTEINTRLGWYSESVTNGTNASLSNVVQQLNDSIATDSDLVKAGISASSSGGNTFSYRAVSVTVARRLEPSASS